MQYHEEHQLLIDEFTNLREDCLVASGTKSAAQAQSTNIEGGSATTLNATAQEQALKEQMVAVPQAEGENLQQWLLRLAASLATSGAQATATASGTHPVAGATAAAATQPRRCAACARGQRARAGPRSARAKRGASLYDATNAAAAMSRPVPIVWRASQALIPCDASPC